MQYTAEFIQNQISPGGIIDLPDLPGDDAYCFIMRDKVFPMETQPDQVVVTIPKQDLGLYPKLDSVDSDRHSVGGDDAYYRQEVFYFAEAMIAWRIYTIVDTLAKRTKTTFLGPYIVE